MLIAGCHVVFPTKNETAGLTVGGGMVAAGLTSQLLMEAGGACGGRGGESWSRWIENEGVHTYG